MYTVLDYGHMAADPVRLDAYARAIARAVSPGAVVADLGTGTGMLALLAARAGAARVHAIDVNPAVWLASELAADNDLADRIVVHEASSLDVTLPERVDVVVSDLRGAFPLHGDHLAILHDASTRLLAPGGKLLPVRDRLMAGVVESDELWQWLAPGWSAFERRGLSATSARTAVLNAVYSDHERPLHAHTLLTAGAPWHTLTYGEAHTSSLEGSIVAPVLRRGITHAIALWFEATILDDLGYDNAPGTRSAYPRRVLPLAEPTAVDAGDVVEVTLRAGVRGDRWAWDTTVKSGAGAMKQALRQSTFLGTPGSPASLLRRSSAFRPTLSPLGERAVRALSAMDGTKTVAEIAASGGTTDALDEVRELASRYAR